MGKRKDLNDFEKGQIVMARRLGQSISQTAGLVGCSRYAVVSTYQKWSKEGQPVNRRLGHGRPRLIDARGERRLARLVRSHRRATVAQIAERVNAGFDRKVSEHTVHRSLLRMGLRNRRPGRKRALEEHLGQERVSEPTAEEEEEEEEEEDYYYQPLNQEPDGAPNTQLEQNDEATHADQLQELQERIEERRWRCGGELQMP
ncbi:uncharacterized protein Hap1MRO34_009737 isoform 1-T6 [Clarias gariepinus]|uniref:uncharacterized protein LOC128529175 isoform X2 n=1 Tax=Clarias gariepinus TaxID=13013 RepID=UPI00234C3D5E|nr:uncharacterized protein LOC128529175 isoform X2 [Clarias gariepinus]